MRIKRESLASTIGIAVLSLAMVLGVGGCQAEPVEWSQLGSGGRRRTSDVTFERESRTPREVRGVRIVPQSNQEVADLSSDDIVRIMRRIGFPDDLVLELGGEMHEAMLYSGAARVFNGKRVEALLRVNGRYISISSLSAGMFVYDPATGQFSGAVPSR